MIKINFAHLCEYAFLSKQGKPSAVGIFSEKKVNKLPALVSRFFLIYEMKVEEEKVDNVKVSFLDPDGEEIFSKDKRIGKEIKSSNLGGILDINSVKFEKEGVYYIKIFTDGEEKSELTLDIKELK